MIRKSIMLTAIETFRNCYEDEKQTITPEMFAGAMQTLNMVEEFVRKMPAEQGMTTIKGVWGMTGDHFLPYRCSYCGIANDGRTPHCPNCGAEMEVKNEKSLS